MTDGYHSLQGNGWELQGTCCEVESKRELRLRVSIGRQSRSAAKLGIQEQNQEGRIVKSRQAGQWNAKLSGRSFVEKSCQVHHRPSPKPVVQWLKQNMPTQGTSLHKQAQSTRSAAI